MNLRRVRYYWQERARLTGCAYDWQTRCAVFYYARIQAAFTTLLAVHRAWEKCARENLRMAADAPDPYMRFYYAALNDVLDRMSELANDMESDD